MSGPVALAATQGRLEALYAMRDKLATAMDGAEPAVVAQINGQLLKTLAEIAEVEAAKPPEVSAVDELLDRRRISAGSPSASGRRRNVRRA
jgi:phytoene/squalene synthetase